MFYVRFEADDWRRGKFWTDYGCFWSDERLNWRKRLRRICFRVIPWLAVMVTCWKYAAAVLRLACLMRVYVAEITTDRKEHSALDSTACLTEPKSAAKGYSIFRLLKPSLISPCFGRVGIEIHFNRRLDNSHHDQLYTS